MLTEGDSWVHALAIVKLILRPLLQMPYLFYYVSRVKGANKNARRLLSIFFIYKSQTGRTSYDKKKRIKEKEKKSNRKGAYGFSRTIPSRQGG